MNVNSFWILFRDGIGESGFIFSVRFEVAVDRGWLDFICSVGVSVYRKGGRGVVKRVEVMGIWVYGDVDILGIIICSFYG